MATELWQFVFTFVMKTSFIFMRIKNHINGFALSLALKQRLESTRKWPTHLSLVNSALLVLPQSSRADLRCHGGLFSFDLDYRINRYFVFHSIFSVLLLSWMKYRRQHHQNDQQPLIWRSGFGTVLFIIPVRGSQWGLPSAVKRPKNLKNAG